VILLLALVATAYFVLRGPDRSNAEAEPPPAPAAQQAIAPEVASTKQTDAQAQAEAKRAAAERQRAEEEKANAEKKAAEKRSLAPELPRPVTPAPPVQPPQSQPQPPSAALDACVSILVTGGQQNRFKITLVELQEPSSAIINGQTNNRGLWYSCGFKAGNRLRILVFRMKEALRATR
jgi:hypothetical protein